MRTKVLEKTMMADPASETTAQGKKKKKLI